MKIILIVNESIGRRLFLSLNNNNKIDIIGICIDSRSKDYEFYKNYSKNFSFKIFDQNKINSKIFYKWAKFSDVDIILNIFSFIIISKNIVKIPKIGFFNLHPGKLPEYSGLNPVSWSIFNGEKYHYVTLHWLNEKIDAGPIAYQSYFKINKKDNAINVMQKCVYQGINLVNMLIKQAYLNYNNIPKIEQNLKKRIYYSKKIPNNGFIDWYSKSEKIINFIRACNYRPFTSPWFEPKLRINKKIYSLTNIKLSRSKCNIEPGIIQRVSNKYIKISTLDYWLFVDRIKYNNVSIDPLYFFTDGDKVKSC